MFLREKTVRAGLSLVLSCSMVMTGVPAPALAAPADEVTDKLTTQQLGGDVTQQLQEYVSTIEGETPSEKLEALWDSLAGVEQQEPADSEEDLDEASLNVLSQAKGTPSAITHAFVLVAEELGFTCMETTDAETAPTALLTIDEQTYTLDVLAAVAGEYPWQQAAEEVEEETPEPEGNEENTESEIPQETPAQTNLEVTTQDTTTTTQLSTSEPATAASPDAKTAAKEDLSAPVAKGADPQPKTTPQSTSLAKATVAVSDQGYTGKAITPAPTVTLGGKKLTADTDYKVTYANNTAVGTATIKVEGKGNYTGTASGTFKIVAPSVSYMVHVQTHGNQPWKKDGQTAGTHGQSKRLEAIWIKLGNNFPISGGIRYRTHVQKQGWKGWAADGALSGTQGESKRLEAIRIELTGNMKNAYDVYYRVHAQKVGWMAWAKNGEDAGTSGMSWRLEAIQIKLVPKGAAAPSAEGSVTTLSHLTNPGVTYTTHVQKRGWLGWVKNGEKSGTEGESKRLEGIKVQLQSNNVPGDIRYRTHVQNRGWMDIKKNGEMSGTEGESKRLEAICIDLRGEVSKYFDVWYRVHSQKFGWQGWTCNGAKAGTATLSKRLESIQICLLPKGAAAPGSTEQSFIDKDPTLSGDPELDAMITDFVAQTGTGYDGLRRAYDIISSYPYSVANRWPGANWEQWSIPYAKEMYLNKTGNCYRYASLMCWTARRLGYDAVVVPGWIPGRVDPRCDHGWVEVNLNGEIYIIDAEMNGDDGYPEYNWFMIKYADAYLRYYDLNDNRLLK